MAVQLAAAAAAPLIAPVAATILAIGGLVTSVLGVSGWFALKNKEMNIYRETQERNSIKKQTMSAEDQYNLMVLGILAAITYLIFRGKK